MVIIEMAYYDLWAVLWSWKREFEKQAERTGFDEIYGGRFVSYIKSRWFTGYGGSLGWKLGLQGHGSLMELRLYKEAFDSGGAVG